LRFVWGEILPPKWGASHRDPNMACLCEEARLWTYRQFLHSSPFYPIPPKSYGLQWVRHYPKSAFPTWAYATPYMVNWVDATQHPKRHLDRFSRFCRAHDCDRPTDRPRYTIISGGFYFHSLTEMSEGPHFILLHVGDYDSDESRGANICLFSISFTY